MSIYIHKPIVFQAFMKSRKLVYNVLGLFDKVFKRKNLVFVLSYHSVGSDDWRFSIDLKTMKKQMFYLKKNFQFISLKTLEKFVKGEILITTPSVVLTFDDGYKDILQLKEYFRKHDIKPALFLLSNAKKVNISEIGRKNLYLNRKEIKALIADGWEIGCHSATHPNLAKLSSRQLNEEIILAKKVLENSLGIKINYFAYPRGKYTKKVLEFAKKAGYRLGVTMDDGFISSKTNTFQIPRIGVDRTHTFSEFKSAFSPSTIAVRRFIKNTFVGKYL